MTQVNESWFSGLTTAFKALTSRGRAFIAGGLTAALCGIILGERDLVRIGVLVLLIPLVSAIVAARGGQRLGLIRRVDSPVIEVGQPTTVLLDLNNLGRRTGVLLVEEQVPWALGQRPRFLVGSMHSGGSRHVQYAIRAEVRGRYEIGPLQVRMSDPFGMLALHRGFPRTSSVVVVPAVEPLPTIGPIGSWTGAGDNRPRPFTVGSAADSTVREYRQGDDLRRVHWRSTARTGELMVRREEQPWQSHCTLFIDNRAGAHRGSGPDSSLERAITVTASIAVHLSTLGYQVQLVSADGHELEQAPTQGYLAVAGAGDPTRPMLEFLASLPSLTTSHLTTPHRSEHGPGRLFIGVLGSLDESARSALLRAQTPGSASYAISLDVTTWASRDRQERGATSTAFLRTRGWKAADLSRGGSLTAAWKELGQ